MRIRINIIVFKAEFFLKSDAAVLMYYVHLQSRGANKEMLFSQAKKRPGLNGSFF